jgi:hypothetical protein
LPALRDFIFTGLYQLPPYLLETLYKYLANLRLYIYVVTLYSLADTELDPYEGVLAGLPLLHRL